MVFIQITNKEGGASLHSIRGIYTRRRVRWRHRVADIRRSFLQPALGAANAQQHRRSGLIGLESEMSDIVQERVRLAELLRQRGGASQWIQHHHIGP